MKHQHLLSLALATMLFVGLYWAISVSASTCSGTFSEKWACGSTVYYSLSGFDSTQTTKIQTGIAEWNALANTNKVTLAPANSVNPAKLEFISGTSGNNCTSGRYETIIDLATSVVISAKVFYHFSNTCTPSGGGTAFNVWDPSNAATYESFLIKTTLHEIGHTMGLTHAAATTETNECQYEDGKTIMNPWCNPNDSGNNLPTTISACDRTNLLTLCPSPTPSPSPSPIIIPPPPETCAEPIQNFTQGPCPLTFQADSSGYYCCRDPFCAEMEEECNQSGGIWKGCTRGCFSPILIDIDGDGFDLTDGPDGIDLDLTGDGSTDRISWTSPGSDDAWLALDRDGNGTINNGMELFGNFTAQAPSIPVKDRNGFAALAEYDKPESGGNGDNFISPWDGIFESLRLWRDVNHNGISEASELKTLTQMGLTSIDLDYSLARRRDGHGNRFAFRSKVRGTGGEQFGRWAWDVFLLSGSPTGGSANAALVQPYQPFQPYEPIRATCGLRRNV